VLWRSCCTPLPRRCRPWVEAVQVHDGTNPVHAIGGSSSVHGGAGSSSICRWVVRPSSRALTAAMHSPSSSPPTTSGGGAGTRQTSSVPDSDGSSSVHRSSCPLPLCRCSHADVQGATSVPRSSSCWLWWGRPGQVGVAPGLGRAERPALRRRVRIGYR
jgi:hypothetical protein